MTTLAVLAALFMLVAGLAGCSDDSANANYRAEPDAGVCESGDEKMEDCNQCICVGHGEWSCTVKECLDGGPIGDGDSEPDAGVCEPGDERMDVCDNTCVCTENGQWQCTLRECVGDAGPDAADGSSDAANADALQDANPQDAAPQDADEPDASPEDTGSADPDAENADVGTPDAGSEDAALPDAYLDADAGQTCRPGDTMQKDCNTCVCVQSGRWQCTTFTCDGAYDPCENKTCGERCTICPPGDPTCIETGALKYCDDNGRCRAGAPPTCSA
jgi:hypothetical protein